MKKIFTLIALCMMAISSQAAITVYVKATEAPYLWAWNTGGDIFKEQGWPGYHMNYSKTVQGTDFWYYTFDESVTTVSLLFNNGEGKQTKDFNGITSDRYFEYDGATNATDVTEQYGGTIPDAEVNSLSLKGNHDGWAADEMFDVVEAGKRFTLTFDTSLFTFEDGYWLFKIRPNAADWVGYSQVYDLAAEGDPDGIAWLEQAPTQDNIQIDLENETLVGTVFTLNASWAGGKDASVGWTLSVEEGTAGINNVISDAAANRIFYNLAGQPVKDNYRGLIVTKGKKMLKK